MHHEEYCILKDKYRIATSMSMIQRRGESAADYDVIYECIGQGYAHTKYRILKNEPRLSDEELAIICDGGCLPFGFRREGNVICVYTD